MLQVEVKRTMPFLRYAEKNFCGYIKTWRKVLQTKADIFRLACLSVKSHSDSLLEIFNLF